MSRKMNFLYKYIKYKYKTLLMFFFFSLVIVITFILFHVSLKVAFYPLVLCAIVGIAALAIDYYKTRSFYLEMDRIIKYRSELIDELPAAGNFVDESYQNLVSSLISENLDLMQASEMKNREMIDYYTLWAHQIKTPIASMRLTLQNEDSDSSRKLRSDLGRIESYVNMVLTFLRLDSESTDYVFKETDINEVIRPIVRNFAPDFIAKHLKLEYANLDLKVVTDEKWLAFVIEQLISNSVKYTEQGSIEIFLQDDCTLAIKDTGIGIMESDLPRIFEKGYTGFNGRIDKKASGIGLYLSKRVCDNLGIKISCESEVGKGTTMYLLFPRFVTKM